MHRTIGYLSKRFVHVQPGEGRKVLLTFLYFFLIITAYYIIKPVSRSMVLGELGSRLVPYVDLICAVVMGPVVTLFARFVDRLPKPPLVGRAFALVTGLTLLFWQLLQWPIPWMAGIFYVWVSIFSVLVVTLFWLVANDLYRPREAKRLFGFIGSGGILGGVVGSSIAAVGAQLIGTKHLLLLSAMILVGCWAIVRRLWRFTPGRIGGVEKERVSARHDTFLSDVGSFARLLLQSRYLMLLVAVVGLNKLLATLMYYQFNPFIEQAFPDQDAKTTFTSLFFGGMNVVSFLVQFFLTSWVLRRWGLSFALLALPVGLLTGSTALLFIPSLWVAATTELYDGSMNYSLQQTTKEVLYLPIDRSIRYKVKPFIDMVVFRFGKGLAAVIGIVLLDVAHAPTRVLTALALPFIGLWMVAALKLRRQYVETVRTVLQARALAGRRPGESVNGPPSGSAGYPSIEEAVEPTVEPFGSLLTRPSLMQRLALVDRLTSSQQGDAPHTKDLIDELIAYEARPTNPLEPEVGAHGLREFIADPRMPVAMRCLAIRRLVRVAEQATVDYLLGIVIVEGDAALRQEAVKALVKLRLCKGELEFPAKPIHRQVAGEVANYQRILQVAAVYRQHHRGPVAADDPVIALLRLLMTDVVEQIFRLLMLLYHPDDIHLVYEQLRAADGYLRADALELLDNLVDPTVRRILWPILDEDQFLAQVDEGLGITPDPVRAYRVLQEAIWDHNCWLSVTTMCAVGRLRLSPMRQELERASRQNLPVVSKAAKVALHLSSLP